MSEAKTKWTVRLYNGDNKNYKGAYIIMGKELGFGLRSDELVAENLKDLLKLRDRITEIEKEQRDE